MDSSSTQNLDHIATKKQLALHLVGTNQKYQNYKLVQQLPASIFPDDLHYYNDTFYYRHQRNIQQIQKIKQLLLNKIIKPQMLIYNTWNSFYPSYILHHHIFIYMQVVKMFSSEQNIKKGLYNKAEALMENGALFHKQINIQFQEEKQQIPKPILNEQGQIQMNKKYYYFDKHVSLYFHFCCFLVKKGNDNVLVFVSLRDSNGELKKDIIVKDLGERISGEYLQIAYNFNKVKPLFAIRINNQHFSKILAINSMSYFYQYNLSLLDLKKSLFIAIRYTSMRQQFKTIPNSKSQRPIISYQAVGSRIINGYAKLVCFSQLNKSLLNNQQIIPFVAQLLDINHHLILESVIRLRECCGGFGYLQVAGHGSGIERLTLRASQAVLTQIPKNPQILKRLHYYSSSDDLQQYFAQTFTKQTAFNPMIIFTVFINICINMRKSSSQMKKQLYLRHFMHQASIQMLCTTQKFTRLPRDSPNFLAFFYQVSNYIISNSQFINWKHIEQKKITKQQYFKGLIQFRNNYLNKLLKKIDIILQVLEVNRLRNVIIGSRNKEEFYEQVLKSSSQNLRNSQEFLEYVKKPIIEFLNENNKAKL